MRLIECDANLYIILREELDFGDIHKQIEELIMKDLIFRHDKGYRISTSGYIYMKEVESRYNLRGLEKMITPIEYFKKPKINLEDIYLSKNS